jgi:polysaccharide export outer membrane protein
MQKFGSLVTLSSALALPLSAHAQQGQQTDASALNGGPAAVQDEAQEQIAAPLQVPSADAYRINAGDEIEVYVWGEERLQRSVKVLPDGTFAFPLVGQMLARGLLPSEVEALITNGLRGQYRGQVPQVTVSVVAPAGMQFSVMGRVKSPGTFTPGRYVTVLEALSMAGGPSEFANLDNVLVLRKSGSTLQTLRTRLAPLFKSGADSRDIDRANILRIETGDTVIVP